MIQKNDIIEGFDSFAKAKKQSVTSLKWALGFALVVVLCVLFWAFSVSSNALNKVIVVERSGEYLKTSADNNERLFKALIHSTCEKISEYANSFDRLSVWENQSKACFYANKDILERVFVKYQQDAAYHDAIENGAVYKCKLEEVQQITGGQPPYNVAFTSLLSIYYSDHVTKYRIHSTGEIINTTVQYPENVTGFFFKSLNQRFELLSNGKGN